MPDVAWARVRHVVGSLSTRWEPPLFGANESRYDSCAMTTRYLKDAAMSERGTLTEQGPRHVVAGAWTFLCPRTQDDKPTSEEN